jgi:hypothetical protein
MRRVNLYHEISLGEEYAVNGGCILLILTVNSSGLLDVTCGHQWKRRKFLIHGLMKRI